MISPTEINSNSGGVTDGRMRPRRRFPKVQVDLVSLLRLVEAVGGGRGGGGLIEEAVVVAAQEVPPSSADVRQIEQKLQTEKRIKVYGIYFDFGSDRIKPQSESVLDEIAQVMRDIPIWKLSIEGHTDNVGGDAYNLDLSNRRAAAVKQALVTRYRIDADRLSTAGFSASRPVSSNDTMEGRAVNRRVELIRE